ncbi:unnamed protein product [Cylindrotheca closterium]|uniref:Uncharacterized protein n=1 Tax=Cylindrotheca closterium TaxID=2856 RepID=A0AAD2FZY0_9STRA|nr:unnamed protein product [Cylindrotheca closterium]
MGLMGRRNSLSSIVNLQRFRHHKHEDDVSTKPAKTIKEEEQEQPEHEPVRSNSSSTLSDDESTTSFSGLSSKMMRRHSTGTKSVRFGDCKIRSYPQVLGDHPCCSIGCPVELGWEYNQEETKAINDFEELRDHQRRKSRGELLLSPEERRSILTSSDHSQDAGAIRKACRRQCTRKAQRKIQREFFSS